MNIVSYEQVFRLICSLAKMDPLNVDQTTWDDWRNGAVTRMRDWIWMATEWPEGMTTAELPVREELDGSGNVYRRVVDYPVDAGPVLGVYDGYPHTVGRRIDFTVVVENRAGLVVLLGGGGVESVWLRYRRLCPNFDGRVWEGNRGYEASAVVYFGDDFWRASEAAGPNVSPAVDGSIWVKQEIPARMAAPLARGVYADWIGSEDRAADEYALGALYAAIDELERVEGQNPGMRVVI